MVNENDSIKKALEILTNIGQIVFVLDNNKKLVGSITDRDIKRLPSEGKYRR